MNYSLYLFENSVDSTPLNKQQIIALLIRHQFINHSTDSITYPAGDRLMDYITFLGCSPSLNLSDNQSTVCFHQFENLTGMGGESIQTIRYPGCRHPLQNPVSLLQNFSHQSVWTCPQCGLGGKTSEINWRKTAGISTFFIEISGIFPNEAVPSDKLLSVLDEFTQTNWRWFYSRSS